MSSSDSLFLPIHPPGGNGLKGMVPRPMSTMGGEDNADEDDKVGRNSGERDGRVTGNYSKTTTTRLVMTKTADKGFSHGKVRQLQQNHDYSTSDDKDC